MQHEKEQQQFYSIRSFECFFFALPKYFLIHKRFKSVLQVTPSIDDDPALFTN